MSDLDDQIAAAETAIATAQTAADALTTSMGTLSAAIRANAEALLAAKDAVDAIEPPPEEEPAPSTVLDYGADPTGVLDSTSAFNQAIAAGNGVVPAGTYKVTAASDNIAVRIAAGQSLTFNNTDGPVTIQLAANSKPRYYIIRGTGNGISITGKATIIGDRLSHTYTSGSTHEWGYGVYVSGNSTLIEDIVVKRCTGDGIGLSGDDIVIRDVLATENRRQGMSCFDVDNLQVYDSEFSLTGALLNDSAAPNGPCAGVDIEPDSSGTASVHFTRCKFNGNRAGFLAWLRSEVGGSIACTLVDCQMIGNANGVHAKALAGAITVSVTGSTLANNRGAGIRIETAATFTINNNLFDSITERTDFTLSGTDTRTRYDIQRVGTTPTPTVGTNKYV